MCGVFFERERGDRNLVTGGLSRNRTLFSVLYGTSTASFVYRLSVEKERKEQTETLLEKKKDGEEKRESAIVVCQRSQEK